MVIIGVWLLFGWLGKMIVWEVCVKSVVFSECWVVVLMNVIWLVVGCGQLGCMCVWIVLVVLSVNEQGGLMIMLEKQMMLDVLVVNDEDEVRSEVVRVNEVNM